MKIPPKILKHSVRSSHEEHPRETPQFTENADTPTVEEKAPIPQDSEDTHEAVSELHQLRDEEQQSETVLKPQIIRDIPKPAPVEPKAANPIEEEGTEEEEAQEILEAAESEDLPEETSDEAIEVEDVNAKKKKPTPKLKEKKRLPRSVKSGISPEGRALAKRIQNQTDLQRMPESLPVLEAFQDFLDSEQRKMRRRITTLSIVFTIITISLIVGGLAAAWHIINPLKSEVDLFRSSIAALENSAASNKNSNDAIVTKLNEMIEHERELNRDTASEIASQVNSYGDNLIEIKDLIAKLQSENDALKTQLGDINRDLPDVTYKVATILNEIDKIRSPVKVSSTPEPVADKQPEIVVTAPVKDEPSVIANGASSKTFSAIITFVPMGLQTRVACQLPIPE